MPHYTIHFLDSFKSVSDKDFRAKQASYPISGCKFIKHKKKIKKSGWVDVECVTSIHAMDDNDAFRQACNFHINHFTLYDSFHEYMGDEEDCH